MSGETFVPSGISSAALFLALDELQGLVPRGTCEKLLAPCGSRKKDGPATFARPGPCPVGKLRAMHTGAPSLPAPTIAFKHSSGAANASDYNGGRLRKAGYRG